MENKDELIDKIRECHPGMVPEKFKHYAWYVGGMRDTGDWYYEVMIKDTLEHLKECLELIEAYPKIQPATPRIGKKVELTIDGKKYWFDFDEYKASEEYREQKEKEYWAYHFSGQRTIDMFGIEGAKRVLEEQDKRDGRDNQT